MPDLRSVDDVVEEGRKELERAVDLVAARVRSASTRSRLVAGVALASVVALGIGIVIYRRRSSHTLAARLERALPDSVRELPQTLKPARAKDAFRTLSRPLRRAMG